MWRYMDTGGTDWLISYYVSISENSLGQMGNKKKDEIEGEVTMRSKKVLALEAFF